LLDMRPRDVDAVWAVERSAYAFPWSRGNFVDSLAAGYWSRMLVDPSHAVLGYCVAMPGVDEMHLLNLTVAPGCQRRGHARTLLDDLEQACRERALPKLWLEVRASNERAREVYARRGFVEVGVRRGYYPAPPPRREDAIVMNLRLSGRADHALD
jgi:ribosomal-protein-alanine N-acetyltransferase